MRIMLDSNVIISAGLFPGKYNTEITLKIAENYKIVLSTRIIDELHDVVKEKFPEKSAALERFLERLNCEISHTPSDISNDAFPVVRDIKDYQILASAIIADVDVFVTNDKDFEGLDLDRPEILTVSDFEKKYL